MIGRFLRLPAVSPTAHYTGHVWARNGLGPKELDTLEGRALYLSVQPLMAASRLTGSPAIEDVLLARHAVIDALLTAEIESGRVTQVVEIAAGMSPRGYTFTQRFGDRISYVETDLADNVATKREALERLGALSSHHRIVEMDALSAKGDASLAAVLADLDHAAGIAVISEGLLNYLPVDAVADIWSRIASETAGFSHAVYLADLFLSGDRTGHLEQAFVALLGAFVRGRIHLHFARPTDAINALRDAGFADPQVHLAFDFEATVPQARNRGATSVRIVKAG